MRLVDVNIPYYAAIPSMPFHAKALAWLEDRLNSDERMGLPWESVLGFVRLTINPRITVPQVSVEQAWQVVQTWLDRPNVWIPLPTPVHREVLRRLMAGVPMTHKLLPDAHLAAIAIGHDLTLASADTDFVRFPGLRYENPLAD
jgi:toxin-antitoxin system PIN domain toxin